MYTDLKHSYRAKFAYFEYIESLMIENTETLAHSPGSTQSAHDSLYRQCSAVSTFCWNLLRQRGSHDLRESLLMQATQFLSSHLVYLDQIPASFLLTNQLDQNPLLLTHVSAP